MPGYLTHIRTLRLGDRDYRIRSLIDVQQFADPDGLAERAGISSAQWSLFGHVWPCGRMLAEAMSRHDVGSRRVLEVGCGLALSSLVLRRRGIDVTASDIHPLAEVFLAYNAALNDLPSVPYRTLEWSVPNPALGRYDLVIASDVLYERGHVDLLVALLQRHAAPGAEVLIADPGRGNSAHFTRGLREQGYVLEETRRPLTTGETPPFSGRLLHYRPHDALRGVAA